MGSIQYIHTADTHNEKAALEILPYILEILKIRSVLDIGCGNGSWLSAAKQVGVNEIQGVDGIKLASEQLLINDDNLITHDLKLPLSLNRNFDLALCLEVAEHLPETAADEIVKTLVNHSNCVLFSAAIPGQGGQFHLNEQWPEYWHEKFKKHGFVAYDILRAKIWNNENVFWWYKQNIILFAKQGVLPNDIKCAGEVSGVVHPELYRKKMTKPKYIKSNTILLKLIYDCFKRLLKK
ncbi:class I SAM-dependent methyltransferase [Aestuariibaculum suncheonense]|uniref:Class I SAM-dependent methyltransferase n=1 Tax=Aestuariibaculum suncheonense TaxID=1028745 RepID=A0A8J6QNM2_9FLAO|nr:class I SAM-dependent methyltransferase [Aestuariibaculum suncheonense]MBD0837027.1 class I SAM-dependent methyltransferase [Aestuariibaculum suncheonense]